MRPYVARTILVALLTTLTASAQTLLEGGLTDVIGHTESQVWFEKQGTVWVTDGSQGAAVDTRVPTGTYSHSVDPLIVYGPGQVDIVHASGQVTSVRTPLGGYSADQGSRVPRIWTITSWVGTALTAELHTYDLAQGSWSRSLAHTPTVTNGVIDNTFQRPDRYLIMVTDNSPPSPSTRVYDLLDGGRVVGGTINGPLPRWKTWPHGVLTPYDGGGGTEWTVHFDYAASRIIGVSHNASIRQEQAGFYWLEARSSFGGEFAPLDPDAGPNVLVLPLNQTVNRMVWCNPHPSGASGPSTFLADVGNRVMVTYGGMNRWYTPASLQGFTQPTILDDGVQRSLVAFDTPTGCALVSFDRTTFDVTNLTTRLASHPGSAMQLSDRWLFDGEDGAHGRELWSSDGTAGRTRRLADLEPGAASSNPRHFMDLDDRALFLADVNGSTNLYSVRAAEYVTYRQSCAGSAGTPVLSADLPIAGDPWTIRVDDLRPNTMGYMFFALDDRRMGLNQLPLDLVSIGAPGCFVNVVTEPRYGTITQPLPSNAQGEAIATVGIPNNVAVLGFEFFNQYVSLDAPPSRQLGITTTNAGRGVVGRF